MPTIKPPSSKEIATLLVAVKCRPLTEAESIRSRHIIQVTDEKGLTVLDPDLSKGYLDSIQKRTKERKYSFDHVFGPECTNEEIYRKISSTIAGVIQGLNATVFAYGSTGSGKTYTMVGTWNDPGLMVLSLNTIFDLIKEDASSDTIEVSCSYLEVYNEVIYDLLEKSSGHLELREDPEHGIIVAGLKSIKVQSADKILELLNLGNSRRKTESTEVNATSSRSHAVLEITVKRKQNEGNLGQILRGKLALVDLAGSERASETNSGGQKLRDGANINRSLLALANCINALGKQQKKGLAYVPYRNSKLTRILKDGLSGNSQTVMVATISPADDQYHHTVNTLKYADRAKEIKTHIHKNIGMVDTHVADYQRMIENLQVEVCRLRKELAEKESQLSSQPVEKAAHDELSCLNTLSHETSENVQERINLQKALFELEETNLRNRIELEHLDDAIAKQQAMEKDGTVVQALRSRRQIILDNIRDNDEAGSGYQKEIELNEKCHSQLQNLSEEAISNNGNRNYLHILSQYRLLGMANTELQFEIAMRDQFIHKQREAQRSLWGMLLGLGLDQKQITDLAAKKAALVADLTLPHLPSSPYLDLSGQPHASTPGDFHHHEGFSSIACLKSQCHGHAMCRPDSYFGRRQRGRSQPSLYKGFISSSGSEGHRKQPKNLDYCEPLFTKTIGGSERHEPPETNKETFVAKTNKRAVRKTVGSELEAHPLEFAVDLTNDFETNEVFTSREALIHWCQSVGRELMTIIIVRKSDKATSVRKARLVLGCERGGNYRDHRKTNLSKAEQKKQIIGPQQTGNKQQKIDLGQTAGTRKCNCPFELKGIPLDNDMWKLEVTCGKHNHELPKTLVGHAYAGRLSLEERKILVDMTLSGVKPREVFKTIKRQNGTNMSTMKTIYNAKAKLKLANMESRKQMRENGVDMSLANSELALISPHMRTYLDLLPEVMRPYIEDIQDVSKDGNCGYRAVASLLGLSQKTGWKQIRNDMIQELLKNRSFYETIFGVDFYSEVGKILDCYESPCPTDRWMQMPDMGYLVATTYRCVLVFISEDQCLTFLPLLEPPVSGTPHKIISIGLVYRGHYVKLFLKKDAPLPPIGTMWLKHRKEEACEWAEPYEGRIQEFLRIAPQNIAMIDFVDEMKMG